VLRDPPLTTVALDRRALGRALAARLLRAADHAELGDHVEPVHLVVRGSTGPPPRRR
jgi:LacI family transcriptional regulator